MNEDSIILKPIGIIHSPFKKPEGAQTPRHLPLEETAEACARVEIFPEYEPGLKDLEGFERIILVFQFNHIHDEKLLVYPYHDRNNLRGVFATKAPCRPNRIGVSCVKLVKIEKNILHVKDVDILDGTPLLDIKPYIPRLD